MTTSRPIIISEPLCFLTTKRGRFAVKQLKSLLFDFYNGDTLSTAKDVLLDSMTSAKIDGIPNKMSRRRRDSKENPENKIQMDIDDLVTIITFLDENKLFDRLPILLQSTQIKFLRLGCLKATWQPYSIRLSSVAL